ncbi:helix-turn-helix transcriptional regulator [Variovorax sp. PBL-E5]|uniref:helix-turn-helix transcriptional regulator n=1 Tax=Variovorax sp. PBL-E5 TaxID=434014 RepID=UPI001316FC15|nr:AlpA family phage regulatory protein [Variovorax sp. PBL-E5]VTU28409.1 putative transcriptional regulator [Variovorax sp. PBL-E5]
MDKIETRSVRPPQARALLGNIGNTTLWRWVKERPDFPRPVKIGPRVTVFRLDELIAWRDKQGEMAQ